MLKRIGLFLAVNWMVLVTINIILSFFGINSYYLTSNGIDYTTLMIICLLWGMVGSFISLFISKWIAKKMMGVVVYSTRDPHYGELVRKVHEISRRAGLQTMPEVGVYDSPVINAFATGRSRNSSLVAVSTGLIHKMREDEIEGVLAHEVAHIANGDMVTMAILQGVINAFVMFLARIVAYAIQSSMRSASDRDDGGHIGGFSYMITVFVLEVIFGIIASTIVMAFSRWREYRADAGSARLVGKDKMIAALQALQKDYELMQQASMKPAVQTMSISSKGKGGIMKLFSSHPDLGDRIKALAHLRR